MATPTASVSVAVFGRGALTSKSVLTIPVGQIVQIQTSSLDAQGGPSGHHVFLSTGDRTIAQVSSAHELGAAPAGVIGTAPGVTTLIATSADNSAATVSIPVTVQ